MKREILHRSLMEYNGPVFDPNNYLTIVALEDGLTVSFSNSCLYCINGSGEWVELASSQNTPPISLGESLHFKTARLVPNANSGIGTFTTNKKFDLRGNIMSMLFGDDARTEKSLANFPYAFKFLFRASYVVHVSKNFLPATTLSIDCYRGLFYECPYLVNSPDLPSVEMCDSCYRGMFFRCTSLIEVCELPAMQLAENCYWSMYQFCSALETAQEILPAMNLKESCYSSMYNACGNLKRAPKLPALTLVSSCYTYLFRFCYDLNSIYCMCLTELGDTYNISWVEDIGAPGTFIKNREATWANRFGRSFIPSGWEVVQE